MIVDSHAHVWSSDILFYPWSPILAHVPPPSVPAPVEVLVDDMDRAKVDKVVLVQPSVYGWDNRYLMRCLAGWPEHFVGLCLIDPRSSSPKQDLMRWCGTGGCRGLRLNLIRQGDVNWLAGPAQVRLFETLELLDLSLSFHMDIEQAPVIALLAARHPAVPFIVDYLGPLVHRRTDLDIYVSCLAEQPNVCMKLLCVAEDAKTPYPFPDIIRSYRSILSRFGAHRIMFGSDYPGSVNVCSYEEIVAWGLSFPGLSEAERDLIMGGTAARIFRL